MTTVIVDKAYLMMLFGDDFKDVPVARVTAFIEIAQLRVAPSVWGDKTKYATALLAAHMMKATEQGSTGGPIVSEGVGDLSRSYGTLLADSSDAVLGSTRYGAEFVNLRNATIVPGTTTGGSFGPGVRAYPDYSGGWGGGWNGGQFG